MKIKKNHCNVLLNCNKIHRNLNKNMWCRSTTAKLPVSCADQITYNVIRKVMLICSRKYYIIDLDPI